MAPMRQQPVNDESWTEAEAMRLVRGWAVGGRARAVSGNPDMQARRAVLTRTVQDEVIPRLIMARHPRQRARDAMPCGEAIGQHVEALVKLLLTADPPEAASFVEALHAGGVPADSLYLDLLGPAARRLGVMWEEDLCDFADVTVGLLRLANVMRLVNHAFDYDADTKCGGPRALLAQMPGEQHGFGLAMVVHFFRRAGWNVRNEPSVTSAGLAELAAAEWFGIVGLSVSCHDRLDVLAKDIRTIRRVSRNPAIGVMVGGPPFVADPHLATKVGADATAADGRQAVQQAQRLVSLLARER